MVRGRGVCFTAKFTFDSLCKKIVRFFKANQKIANLPQLEIGLCQQRFYSSAKITHHVLSAPI